VLCLIVVPLPPVKTPFAVQLNNNNYNNNLVTRMFVLNNLIKEIFLSLQAAECLIAVEAPKLKFKA
jgi:hypothetical protein